MQIYTRNVRQIAAALADIGNTDERALATRDIASVIGWYLAPRERRALGGALASSRLTTKQPNHRVGGGDDA